MTEPLEIKYLPVGDLTPYANNSRTHSAEQIDQIVASINEFGFTNPILIDDDGGIIAGHGRLLAAARIGMDSVPSITLSGLTDIQRKAYVIADNKLALNAGWDAALLATEIDGLQDMGFNLKLEDAVPDVPDDPITKLGDIYQLGNHRLMCGDSTSIDAVDKLMDGQLADQFITDPPYNVALGMNETPEQAKLRNRRTDGLTVANDSMGDSSFRQFLVDAFTSADMAMKPGAVFYIWHSDAEGYNFRGACHDIEWEVRQCRMMELDPKYCDVIVKRWEEFTGNKATLST